MVHHRACHLIHFHGHGLIVLLCLVAKASLGFICHCSRIIKLASMGSRYTIEEKKCPNDTFLSKGEKGERKGGIDRGGEKTKRERESTNRDLRSCRFGEKKIQKEKK